MPAIFVVFWGVGDGNFSEDFVWWKVLWLGIELEKSEITQFPSKYEGKYIFCCLMFKFFVWKIAQEIPRKLTFQIKFDTKCLNLVQFLIENWLMWERFNTLLSKYASLAIKSYFVGIFHAKMVLILFSLHLNSRVRFSALSWCT